MDDRELLARHERYLKARNRARSTVEQYRRLNRAFSDWLGPRTLDQATREDVEAFLAGRRIGPTGRCHYLSILRSLYAWMIDEELCELDPTRRIPRPVLPRGLPRPVESADLLRAFRLASPRTAAFIALAALAGLRAKEVAGVAVRDLLFHLDPPALLVSNPKGHHERVVPLHVEVHAALAAYGIPRSGYLFPGTDGGHVKPYVVSQDVGRHFRDLGIPASCHQLRHWCATAVYQESRDLRLTQTLLGHRDPSSTAIYAAFDQSQAAKAVGRLTLEGT